MSRDASIELDFADGTYRFRLAIGQLAELDEKTDRGPLELLSMIDNHTWRPLHVREVIRIGLIGGGTAPAKATVLLKRYLDDMPWVNWLPVARAVLFAAIAGPPDGEKTGKKRKAAKARQGQSDREGSSRSPLSTEQQQSSGSRRSK